MDFKVELLDPTILDEGFSMGSLWLILQNLNELKISLEALKVSNLGLDPNLQIEKINDQLNHVNYNIGMVEMTMDMKESLIFMETGVFIEGEEETASISLN